MSLEDSYAEDEAATLERHKPTVKSCVFMFCPCSGCTHPCLKDGHWSRCPYGYCVQETSEAYYQCKTEKAKEMLEGNKL